NRRAKELSTRKTSAEPLSLTTVPLAATAGRVVRQSSRPVAPSIAVTLAPEKTISLSSPDRERSRNTADEPDVARVESSFTRRVLHQATPLDASRANMTPSLLIPTRSKLAAECRCANNGCAISPTAARQPPR